MNMNKVTNIASFATLVTSFWFSSKYFEGYFAKKKIEERSVENEPLKETHLDVSILSTLSWTLEKKDANHSAILMKERYYSKEGTCLRLEEFFGQPPALERLNQILQNCDLKGCQLMMTKESVHGSTGYKVTESLSCPYPKEEIVAKLKLKP